MKQIVIELDFPEGVIRFSFGKKGEQRLLRDIACDLLPMCDMLTAAGSEIARKKMGSDSITTA